MYLSVSDAVKQVRTRLDELSSTESDMFLAGEDDRNLIDTISNLIPEAIRAVHLAAPSSLMTGLKANKGDLTVTIEKGTGVVSLDTASCDCNVLRLVSLKAEDSDITIYKAHNRESIWGKMQSNKYLRGTFEHPFLIEIESESDETTPCYKYYCVKDPTKPVSFDFTYFPVPIEEKGKYYISYKLEISVINYLTALVLQTYEKIELANIYFQRAKDAMEQ